jgi:phage-related protein
MGIAGTTAKEASETIGGSVASMKSAWQNLAVGIADENANIDELMNNFLDSVSTVASNILPVVERVLGNIFQTLADNAPQMLEKAVELFLKIAAGAIKAIPGIVKAIPDIINAVVNGFKSEWPQIVEVGKEIVRGLWAGIQNLGSWLKGKVSNFIGGIVDNVKGVLGIHSPSTVFASVGENMALGLGQGWDDEYTSIKKGITKGLDFGTAKIGVNASGSVNRHSEPGKPINIVVQSVLNGKVIGETSYRYSQDLERAYGGA